MNTWKKEGEDSELQRMLRGYNATGMSQLEAPLSGMVATCQS
jgi:hypothetical protein